MFERGNTLILSDDKEYAVVDKFNENEVTYVYLIDINDNENKIFSKLENDEIVEIVEPELLEMVIKRFNDNLHQH